MTAYDTIATDEDGSGGGLAPRFGRYRADREIGRGGMGTVYEARDPVLNRRLALKAMSGALIGDPVAEARFMREARALASLNHPHIVRVFEFGVEDGRPFLVMELLDGQTLEALLAREERLSVARAVEIVLPLLSAVTALHDQHVVHRDLKPGNIMLARRGRSAIEPVVLDFGIARLDGDRATVPDLTRSEALVGTLPYLSPEQVRDGRTAGPATDQYSLGVILYECITGRKPFGAGDNYELMRAVMTASVARPSALCPAIPAALDEIVLRAMSRQPDDRYPTVAALGRALLTYADGSVRARWAADLGAALDEPQQGATPPTNPTLVDVRAAPAEPVGRRTVSIRAALAAAAAACVVVALVVGVAVLRPKQAPAIAPARHPSPPAAPMLSSDKGAIVPTRPRAEAEPAAVLQGDTPRRAPQQTAPPTPHRPREPGRWRTRPGNRSAISRGLKPTDEQSGRPVPTGAGAARPAIGDDDAIDPNASLE